MTAKPWGSRSDLRGLIGGELRKGPRGVSYLRSQQTTGEKCGLNQKSDCTAENVLRSFLHRKVDSSFPFQNFRRGLLFHVIRLQFRNDLSGAC